MIVMDGRRYPAKFKVGWSDGGSVIAHVSPRVRRRWLRDGGKSSPWSVVENSSSGLIVRIKR